MSKVLSAVAWPYANGPRHIGHIAGFALDGVFALPNVPAPCCADAGATWAIGGRVATGLATTIAALVLVPLPAALRRSIEHEAFVAQLQLARRLNKPVIVQH